MSRYTGPVYRKSRRLGFSTLENGKELSRKPYVPGIHGASRRKKASEYGIQLQEKQKLRFMYGLTEKQFARTFEKAAKMKGIAGENLLKLLESRLDNIVYRMGLSNTRRGSRQVVNHGHILVNGQNVDIPSYTVNPGDIISIKEKSLNHPAIKQAIENTLATGTFIRLPERTELNADINESLVVEYYNR